MSLLQSHNPWEKKKKNICILIDFLHPCLSTSLTLLRWTLLLQKQFSIIICGASPLWGHISSSSSSSSSFSLPGNYRRATDAYLRQHKLDAADNVITQSLHIGVHSLWAKTKNLGIVDKAWAMPKMYKVAENIMSIISCRQFKMIRPNRWGDLNACD